MTELYRLEQNQIDAWPAISASSPFLELLDIDFQLGEINRQKLLEDISSIAEDPLRPADLDRLTILSAAKRLNMLKDETPLYGNFDVVMVLGSSAQSPLWSTKFAAKCIATGLASSKHFVVTGSDRVLKKAESKEAGGYAMGAMTEFDLAANAARFVASKNAGLLTSQLQIDHRKAEVPEVIEAVLNNFKEIGSLNEESRIGAVTDQLHQTAVSLELARVALGFGITKTYASGSPVDKETVDNLGTDYILRELLYTLRSAARTYAVDIAQPAEETEELVEESELTDLSLGEDERQTLYITASDGTYISNGSRTHQNDTVNNRR